MGSPYILLDHEATVHLRGADIARFLQGQLTCDTRELAPGGSVYGALCNAQGRVLADVRVVQLAEQHVALRLRHSIAAPTAETLATYARFSRIDCAVDDGGWRVLGVPGDEPPNAAGGACYAIGDGRWEVLLPTDNEAAQQAVSATAAAAWAAAELRGGVYRIEAPDRGEFTPQALNYDLAGLVSFSKGCYTGQEVVARLHYRGKSKRRLAVLAAPPGSEPPVRGQAVDAPGDEAVGQVLRAEVDEHGSVLIAAALRADLDAAQPLAAAGVELRRLALPYEAAGADG